jgi:hypothetical protein
MIAFADERACRPWPCLTNGTGAFKALAALIELAILLVVNHN